MEGDDKHKDNGDIDKHNVDDDGADGGPSVCPEHAFECFSTGTRSYPSTRFTLNLLAAEEVADNATSSAVGSHGLSQTLHDDKDGILRKVQYRQARLENFMYWIQNRSIMGRLAFDAKLSGNIGYMGFADSPHLRLVRTTRLSFFPSIDTQVASSLSLSSSD